MKIYYAGAGGKARYEILFRLKAPALFSFYSVVTPNHGFGEHHRFQEATGDRAKVKIKEAVNDKKSESPNQ